MGRVFKQSGEKRFTNFAPLVLMVVLILKDSQHLAAPFLAFDLAVDCFLIAAIVYLLLDAFVARAVVSEDGITTFDPFNRQKATLAWSGVVAYLPVITGDWFVFDGSLPFRMPKINYQDFHAVMVAHAPAALRAKRWRCGQMPISEEFKGICLWDPRAAASQLLAAMIVGAPALWLLGSTGWFVIAMLTLPAVYNLRDLFAHVDMLDVRIVSKRPFESRELRWEDITAIFSQGRIRRRSFTLVAGEVTVTIPAHIARDLEWMRKVFYNLPEGTLCVNFDKNFRKGYRVRRRNRSRLGSFVPEFDGNPS